jgi:monomeric sarcosine oxidase
MGARVIVVGGGTMGVASARSLAQRGHAVTVLERHEIVHDLGSHGGYTRVIRQAYHEGTGYVPLVREAEAQWLQLGDACGESLLVRSGLLELGPDDDPQYRAAIDVCDACEVEHEVVDAATARARWPIELPDDWTACFSPSGGYLRVAACLRAMADDARNHGAEIRTGCGVAQIEPRGPAIEVRLEDGSTQLADRVVVTAGAWLPRLLAVKWRAHLRCLRRLLAWTRPSEAHRRRLAAMPVWGAFVRDGFFYGFPWVDEGVDGFKLACHTSPVLDFLDVPVDPDTVDRTADGQTLAVLEAFLGEYLPAAAGPWVATKACLYTVTPHWDFLIDRLPDDPRIVVAGGFSGHGFKFAPAIGRLVADLIDREVAAVPEFSFAALDGEG